MSNDKALNAVCAVCNKPYHVCGSCLGQKSFKPWKAVTDSIEHFKIYSAVHAYTLTKKKESAKADLRNCDLSGLEDFVPEMKAAIHEILN